MKSLQSLLSKFDSTLKEFNPIAYKKLQAPLSKSELNSYLKKLQIDNPDFKALFSWKNGFGDNERGSNHIFDFGTLRSIEQILSDYNTDHDLFENFFIPIITTGDGSAILFSNKQKNSDSQLYLFAPNLLIAPPITYYDSITTLFETTIIAYEKGALKYDTENDWLDEDVYAFRNIASKLNPKSEYWKLK